MKCKLEIKPNRAINIQYTGVPQDLLYFNTEEGNFYIGGLNNMISRGSVPVILECNYPNHILGTFPKQEGTLEIPIGFVKQWIKNPTKDCCVADEPELRRSVDGFLICDFIREDPKPEPVYTDTDLVIEGCSGLIFALQKTKRVGRNEIIDKEVAESMVNVKNGLEKIVTIYNKELTGKL